MSQIINVNGQKYEIENWDEFQNKLLTGIGLELENEIVQQIGKMRLVDTGKFKQGTSFEVNDNELILSNNVPYAVYLEYGTYTYWEKFGLKSFPSTPHPKKKNISRKKAKSLPKGMQPFAPYRRVLYNQNKMSEIIDRSIKRASK